MPEVSTRTANVFAVLVLCIFKSPARRRAAASIAGAMLLGGLSGFQAPTPSHVHLQSIPTAGGWLDRLNLWRAAAGVPSLTENPAWSSGDYNHSLYMVKNDLVTHYETVGTPYYTPEGDTAARNSNIEVNSSTSFTDEQAIDWWMKAPFHALGMMDPRLTQTGFGAYREGKSGWQAGFSLDTIRGNSFSGGSYPVFFPGNGATEPLTSYNGGEYPDPLQGCAGYTAPTGLPVFIQVGGNVSTTAGPVHSFVGNGVPLEHCVIDSTNPGVGSNLPSRGGVIIIPRQPLQNGVKYVVAVTVNGVPYSWSFSVGPFTPVLNVWTSLGGVLTSGPAAVSWVAGRTDVFVRGTDNSLYHRVWNGAWNNWESLGGVLTSAPAAVSWGPDRIDVFVRGTDNALYHKVWAGAWYAWESLGGVLTSDPAVASWSSGRLDVFVRGTDNALYHKVWDGQQWSAWEGLGGGLTSDPASVSWGPNRVDVFVRGTDSGLWHKAWNGAGWSTWESLRGALTSGPDASSCTSGHLDVFAVGASSVMYQIGFNGAWGAWRSLGAAFTADPGAVCQPGASVVDLFARGTDAALWRASVLAS